MKVIHLTPAAVVFLQLGALAVGMASWLDDDENGGDSGGGDEFAVDDGGDFDDDFDDDFGSFDDMDGGGAGGQDASVNELQHRIDELETEVSNVASKANTVRSENEQISESVEDVEENVRKLLEIYEMVTRGVNPFVDDVNTNSMGGGGSQSFGLFDDEDDGDEEPGEELDQDIADADPADFFEDDTFEDDPDEVDDDFDEIDDDLADGDDVGEFEDEIAADDESGAMSGEEDAADTSGGTSFEELKQEYESGEADWATGDEGPGEVDADGDDVDSDDALLDEGDASELGFDDSDLKSGTESTAEGRGADELDTGGFQFGSAASSTDDASSEASPGGAQITPSFGIASRSEDPHLADPQTGYLADVVALEWLDHLLSEFGPKSTVRTLNYYERIGWIGEPVRDQLFDYLEGLTDSDYLYRDEFGSTDLTMDDHMQSLDYIDELASENIERAIVDRFDDLHRNGIQR